MLIRAILLVLITVTQGFSLTLKEARFPYMFILKDKFKSNYTILSNSPRLIVVKHNNTNYKLWIERWGMVLIYTRNKLTGVVPVNISKYRFKHPY